MLGASLRGPVTRSERVRTTGPSSRRGAHRRLLQVRRALRPTDTITCRCFSRRRCRDEGATSVFFSPRAIRASERFLIDAMPRDRATVLLDHLQAAKVLDNLPLRFLLLPPSPPSTLIQEAIKNR